MKLRNQGTSKIISCAATIILAGLAMTGLAGCADDKSVLDPYAAEISRARDKTNSEYVRQVLKDDVITAAELRDSQKQNLTCLNDAGIVAQYRDSGAGYDSLETTGDLVDVEQKAISDCADKWVGEIESIYVDQLTNPQNMDLDALIASCLVRKDLAPQGFTGADFRELIAESSVSSSQQDVGENGIVVGEVTGDIILPGGESMSNPQAIMCQMNPSK